MVHPFYLCPQLKNLHHRERLNYVLGQVLGVNDFQQEQVYFLHKSQLHNRSLHGYGTVWGLAVSTAHTGETLELQVAPGFAIDPQGREVWVDALQCAKLNDWLAAAVTDDAAIANWQTLQPVPVADPDLSETPEDGPVPESEELVAVYVTLCYHACYTGKQPILGDPCRSESGQNGVIQDTRLRDHFKLQLRATPPVQWEETWVRAIASLLAQIDIDPDIPELEDEAIAALTQTLRDGLDDPARIPTLDATLPQSQADSVLRDLFRYWVTHTRPSLDHLHHPVLKVLDKILIDETSSAPSEEAIAAQLAQFTQALDDYRRSQQLTEIDDLEAVTVPGEISTRYRRAVLRHWDATSTGTDQSVEDDCILLAAVQFSLTGNQVDESTLSIVDLQRPYLLHTRLLQELVLQTIVQGAVSELVLDSGTVRYQALEDDSDESGIFPVDPLPSETIAFDVVVPNPRLGTGTVRYQNPRTIRDNPGVFPVTPLDNDVNVAFNVVVPAPPVGNGVARYQASPEESTGVFPVPPDLGNANVAFNVIMPTPPTVLPPLGNGVISMEGDETAGDRSAGVYPAAAPRTDVAFDVVLPRPEANRTPTPHLALRPMEMLLFRNARENLIVPSSLPSNPGRPVTPANPSTINGYPALVFEPTVGSDPAYQVAGFSILRPPAADPELPPTLRLYCTALRGSVRWRVAWRWLRSLLPGESLRPDAQLTSDNFITATIEPLSLSDFHLHQSSPLRLDINADEPDYLAVYLLPELDINEREEQLYLLMADLRWEV
ncbi:MAG: hypothetical protein EA367_16625 [Leptolyngbya sp. DLM2.Bin15]|nr:MAG: hypothetical protein EA367_16625 [Leptolyngbya sp. DLM2.Bin15]